ncbi:MAG: hypothetical protein ABSC08_12435 [Bryobacteraceae bacterium]|jgi:hypothetical protein
MLQQHKALTELDAASGALGFAISTLERIEAGQEVDIRGVFTLLGRVRRNVPKCSSPDVHADAGNPALKRVYHELRMTLEALDEMGPARVLAQPTYNSLAA